MKEKKQHQQHLDKDEIIETNPEILEEENSEAEISIEEQLKIEIEQLKKTNLELFSEKMRILADRENARKYYSNEENNLKKYGAQSVILQILPALDNFELALNSTKQSDEIKNFLKGFAMTFKQLKDALTAMGVKEIEVKSGDKFNSTYHEAIEQVESDKYGPNEIVQILRKGYMLYDRLLRPVMVKIAKESKIENNQEKGEE